MEKILVSLVLLSTIVLTSCKKDLVDTTDNSIEDITETQSFKNKIADGVSVVFFHASWCSVCEEQRPNVEEASESDEKGEVRFIEVEHDDSRDVFDEYNVEGFPQLLFFKNGVEQERLKGKGHSAQKILDIASKYN